MNATQNIALYCASAVLEDFPDGDYIPPFPPAGERGANSDTALTATVEPWRKLTYINMWQLDKFDEATQQAFANSMNVPTWDLQVPDFDSKTRSIITMAAGPQFTVPPNHLPLPEGVQGVREWVYHLPLRTAERVMKLINPDSSNWALDINQASNQLSHLYTTCAWGPRRETPTATTNGFGRVLPNLLFVVQSPWLLGPADFRMFCERSMYRHYAKKNPKTGKVETTELDYVDKLWATIYDDCVRGNTHYFILTTYNEWSFGAFSRGWTTAWTTPPKPYDSGSPELPGPTILQSVLFWMHSSQQFYYDSYRSSSRGRYGSFVDEDGSGLPTPVSPGQSLADDEEELDLASETDDNTLDKGWLNEMRTSMREIKDLKGAKRTLGAATGSWVIPEIWEDMEPPKPPPKRPNPLYSTDEDPRSEDGWYNKRQRPNDEHVTTRRVRPAQAPAPQRRGRTPHPQRPQTSATTQDASSIQANSSVSTAKTSSSRVLPGGFPSGSSADGSAWSPWLSDTSPVKILWSRTFISVRTTLADALRRLLRTKEEQAPAANAGSLPATPAPQPHQPQQRQQRPRTRPAPEPPRRAPEMERFTFNSDSIPEVDENRLPSLAPAPALPIGFSLPQTTVALGGHTITLNPAPQARLMSGIQLEQPVPTQQSWPPPRRPFMPLFVEAPESASDATEIDPDAQRRPECGVPVYEGFY